jgi:glucose-1-phosphate thymidylyltransferase
MSKEIYPVGFQRTGDADGLRPKVACQYLLDRMRIGGAQQAYVILRPGKWDIPSFLGDGSAIRLPLAYLIVHVPFGVPFTLDQAYPFIGDANVLLGFPDILLWPEDAYATLLEKLAGGRADVVLGLFPANFPEREGLVDIDESGRVRGIFEKSPRAGLDFMWALAVWRPSFSEFLHRFVADRLLELPGAPPVGSSGDSTGCKEIPIGDVLHAAIAAGFCVDGHKFRNGRYIDIGTPDQLVAAVRQETQQAE